MTKPKKQFICSSCGQTYLQWTGQCANCKAWNTLAAVFIENANNKNIVGNIGYLAEPHYLSSLNEKKQPRMLTGMSELDKTLGGGLVAGSVILIGGDPGIGKSTLMLQCLDYLNTDFKTLYISGEESENQTAMRAKRLQIKSDLLLLSEVDLAHILALLDKIKPKVVVIDSIQTITSADNNSQAGSVGQVRDCATQLSTYAKKTQTTLLMVGHLTKGGLLAGPRILEHMVDTVLYFEGDSSGRYRIIRCIKNRFGAVNEISVFAMEAEGLLQIKNPSAIFLLHHKNISPGSVVTVSKEASRPLLVELQALVSQSSSHHPARICVGIEQNRLLLLLAILQKHAGITTYDQDIFVNVVGGLKISETASDLSLMIALISSVYNQAIPKDWISFGEVGLSGEVRPVYNGTERLKEAKKHGFAVAIIAKGNVAKTMPKTLKIVAVANMAELLDFLNKNAIN